jgi:regulatory LuxR family protein
LNVADTDAGAVTVSTQVGLVPAQAPLQPVNVVPPAGVAVNAPRLARRFGLTRPEGDVLRWVAAGKTNAEIGTILGMSLRRERQIAE